MASGSFSFVMSASTCRRCFTLAGLYKFSRVRNCGGEASSLFSYLCGCLKRTYYYTETATYRIFNQQIEYKR